MGGKSRVAARLAACLPDHRCYVEVFAGAANLLFATLPSRAEGVNDVHDDLITLFRVVRYHRREFLRELDLVSHSRVEFGDFHAQPGLTDIQRAARFYYIVRVCFGGKAGAADCHFGYGTTGRARFSRSVLSTVTAAHKRLAGVTIEHLDFSACIARYDRPHTVFYCDPPYLDTAGYRDPFDMAAQQRLAATLAAIKGRFLLSINDHPDIRRLYHGHCIRPMAVRYTVSRDKSAAATDRRELLIANYTLPRTP